MTTTIGSRISYKKVIEIILYMTKTLVIILAETRASEVTYESFAANVLNPLSADLCICIGITPTYYINDPFYKNASYKFFYDEPDHYGIAINDALQYFLYDENIPPIHWLEYMKIPNQFMGGVGHKDHPNRHPGSAGILLFYRWFLLYNIKDSGLIEKYDRFIITRSDFIYMLPHPSMDLMDENCIWIPLGENYDGYTDRHVVLSRTNIEKYLNILPEMITNKSGYFQKMSDNIWDGWNLERLIAFHLQEQGCIVKQFPYIMYSIRKTEHTTTWSVGEYSEEDGFFIKYPFEKMRASYYLAILGNQNINDFYKNEIEFIENNTNNDPINNRFGTTL